MSLMCCSIVSKYKRRVRRARCRARVDHDFYVWRKGGRRAGEIVVCKTTNILIVIENKEMFAKTWRSKIIA